MTDIDREITRSAAPRSVVAVNLVAVGINLLVGALLVLDGTLTGILSIAFGVILAINYFFLRRAFIATARAKYTYVAARTLADKEMNELRKEHLEVLEIKDELMRRLSNGDGE